MKEVFPEGAKAVGPYSPGIVCGDLLFVSGQIGIDSEGNLVAEDVEGQAKRALENMKRVVEAGGSQLSSVAKVTIFLVDIGDFAKINEIYAAFMGSHRPARAVVGVAALPKGAKVEIECIARVG